MEVDVRGGEIPRHVPEEATHPALEEVADAPPYVPLVQELIVALLVRECVRGAHDATAEADPRGKVGVREPHRQRAVHQLPPQHEAEGAPDGDEHEDRGRGKVSVLSLGVDEAGGEGAECGGLVHELVRWDEHVLQPEVERLAHCEDGHRPEDEKVGGEQYAGELAEAFGEAAGRRGGR